MEASAAFWCLVLLASGSLVFCTKQRSISAPMVVLRGNSAILKCSFPDLSPDDAVTWVATPRNVISVGKKVSTKYRRHRVVGDYKRGEYNLVINNLQLEDGGEYRCSTLEGATKEVKLVVVAPLSAPPKISGGEIPAKTGESLHLTCRSVGGNPLPQLKWYNGTKLYSDVTVVYNRDYDEVSAKLVLAKVSKWDHSSNFTCVADQGYPGVVGPKFSSRTLKIHYSPSVKILQPSIHAREGETVNLTCAVDSNPAAVVTWKKLGEAMSGFGGNGGHILRIPKLNRRDSGVYQCTADNGIYPIGMGTATVDVLYPPTIDPAIEAEVTVLYGTDDFVLKCLATGNPKPRIRWRRKDTSLYWENPLRFHRVRYDVEGKYECVATSKGFPETTKTSFINVVGRPSIQGRAVKMAVRKGSTARLVCDVIADPVPGKIDWLWRNKNGVENVINVLDESVMLDEKITPQGKMGFLAVKNVDEDREGTYECRASNMFGLAQKEIQLQVSGTQHALGAIVATTVTVVLLAVMIVIGVVLARSKGLICLQKKPEIPRVRASRSSAAHAKYGRKLGHGTNDSGIEDLELHEVDGTLKPRPPPRADKDWASVGLSYSGLVHSATLPPYATVERQRPEGGDTERQEAEADIEWQLTVEPPEPPPKENVRHLVKHATTAGNRNSAAAGDQSGGCEIV
ncbi:irregular chiasm C-roughest protein-like [Branchiostoma lanceolatum]|uniref:irregular chiasm C-roughest protein-like n=1 Tax=Branchiostoma lanceolatum TaxID=7740 RepID=UPI003454B924